MLALNRLIMMGTFLFACLPNVSAAAEEYPNRPIRFVSPYGAGGGSDAMARGVADLLSKAFGQPVVVENRPGANGMIAGEVVARAPADGYTVYVPSDGQMVINPHLYRSSPYDVEKDFMPVSLLGKIDFILVVRPGSGIDSVQQLVAKAKANPRKLNYAHPGQGSPHQLLAERFKEASGTDMVGVPYQQTPQALIDIVEGRMEIMFVGLPPALGLIQAGKLKVLAIAAERRSPRFPDVPTLRESGVDISGAAWWGLVVRRGTPSDRTKKLEQESIAAARNPELIERMSKIGIDMVGSTSQEFGKLISRELDENGAVIRRLGLPKQ